MMDKKTISIITVFLLAVGVAVAGSGLKQMWLTSDRGTLSGSNVDPWLDDSVLVSESPFTIELMNHLPQGSDSIDGSYLIITASRDPRGTDGIQVKIGPAHYSDSTGNTIEQHLIADWKQVSGNNGVTFLGYNTAPHGILTDGTWYAIEKIDQVENGKFLLPALSNSLLIDIAVTSPNPSDRIHIDSEGTHMVSSGEQGFTGNPYSHDLTWQIPEFPTIALPIAAVIGLVFMFQQRKKKVK